MLSRQLLYQPITHTTMTKTLLIGMALLGVSGLPFAASAATYHYLDIAGIVRDIESPNASAALQFVTASPTALHSGVALDMGVLKPGQDFGNDYQYRTVSGGTAVIHAATLDAARMLATDRDSNSGFYLMP